MHIHLAGIDGVYAIDESTGVPRFHFVPAPTPTDVRDVTASVASRVCKMLRRRGLLRDQASDPNEPTTDGSALDACRIAGLSRGRFERIDERGCSQQRLFPDDDANFARRTKSPWTAELDGFSVDARVCFGALDRKGREKLLRYFLRPPIATDRFSILRDGSVAYHTKYGRGSKTHRVMTPMEAMARIAALVPPPHSPLLRYHGVLAAASPLRRHIVPLRDKPREAACQHGPDANAAAVARAKPADRKSNRSSHAPSSAAASTAPMLVLPTGQGQAPCSPPPPQPTARSWRPSTSYIPWAELMKRTLDVDPARCTRCHARLEPIAIITRDQIVSRILSHLRLPATPQPLGPGGSLAYDVTGEPVADWVVGVDPELPDQDARAPPCDDDGIDPPAPECC